MNKSSTYILLPHDKPSEIFLHKGGDMCFNKAGAREKTELLTPQHIYILSDDEVKEGDSFIDTNNEVSKCKEKDLGLTMSGWRKIIATTNPELWDKYIAVRSMHEPDYIEKGVDKISLSDLEYIISLYNGKTTKMGLEEIATNNTSSEEEYRGYLRCLQDNAHTKFAENDIEGFAKKYADTEGKQIILKSTIHLWYDYLKSLTQEQPKRDAVMVEYEYLDNGWNESMVIDRLYKPKLKDGCIVIVRN